MNEPYRIYLPGGMGRLVRAWSYDTHGGVLTLYRLVTKQRVEGVFRKRTIDVNYNEKFMTLAPGEWVSIEKVDA